MMGLRSLLVVSLLLLVLLWPVWGQVYTTLDYEDIEPVKKEQQQEP